MRVHILILLTCLPVLPVHAKYAGGSGTARDPYQIAIAADLVLLGESPGDYDKHFILTGDIDLTGAVFNWAVIAPDIGGQSNIPDYDGTPFSGVLDGHGHMITGLRIDGSDKHYVALFGYSVGDVRNLALEGASISGGYFTGSLIGLNLGTATNCDAVGSVTSRGDDVGGLVGLNGGTVSGCHFSGNITCPSSHSDFTGGLVGRNGGPDAMGLSGTITDCYCTGQVNGGGWLGGLVGDNSDGTISNCYSTAKVTSATRGYVGGLAGGNSAIIAGCGATGDIEGKDFVGGLVGWGLGGSLSNSCAKGNTTGGSYVGGLVGQNQGGGVLNCYSSGFIVKGNEWVGGLIGLNRGSGANLSDCYSTCFVIGNEYVGGLVGENAERGSISASFWDIETSGLLNMCGEQVSLGSGCDNSYGMTTSEMKQMTTFLAAGWGFRNETQNGIDNIWWLPQYDYPRLSWESMVDLPISPKRFGAGTGDPDDPYLVFTPEHLEAIGVDPADLDKCFKLMVDIDLSGRSYDAAVVAPDLSPAQSEFQGAAFAGHFDGNGHVISCLTITGESYIGLFGYLAAGSEIRDLGVLDATVTGQDDFVGSVVGFSEGDIVQCYSTGTVLGGRWVGGIVGGNGGSITDSHSTNTVLTIDWEGAGGLVGANTGNITTSYSTGAVNGTWVVGGLAGYNSGQVNISYSTGASAGQDYVGGLIGENAGYISGCYSTGAVTGDGLIGGLVGRNTGSVAESFWDIEISGLSTSAEGTGKTTLEMQTASTFLNAGWDFIDETENGREDFWWIIEGLDYPHLSWESTTTLVPDLLGMTEVEAQVALTAAGLFIGSIDRDYGDDVPAGIVVSQAPEPGSSRRRGSYVTVTISLGPPPPLDGKGTELDPYRISSLAEFDRFSDPTNSGRYWAAGAHVRLECDIDLAGRVYDSAVVAPHIPRGTADFEGTAFAGVFDGNGFTIRNLTISESDYSGMFGMLDRGAIVQALGLTSVRISGSAAHVGSLASVNAGTVIDCYCTGEITARSFVGGLIGENTAYGRVIMSYGTCRVSGSTYVGGLVGDNRGGSITASYAGSDVNGGSQVGGLVGRNLPEGIVVTSYSIGPVSGGSWIGGLVGLNGGSIAKCYSTGSVVGNTLVGGLVGGQSATDVTSSFWDRQVQPSREPPAGGGGIGLTTAQMQNVDTYLDAGWDFAGETENGTADTWFMPESSYPRLSWQSKAYALIPDVIGMTETEAQEVLAQAGFFIGTVDGVHSDVGPSGTVVDQNPEPISVYPEGSYVNLRISLGLPLGLSGQGTEADPYRISSRTDFDRFADPLNSGIYWVDGVHIRLECEIDLTGRTYDSAVISSHRIDGATWGDFDGDAFEGVFDGNGFTIKGLRISGGSYLGLFGMLATDATIKNLSLAAVNVSGSGDYVGGLLGRCGPRSTVSNCSTTGSVSGARYVGGLAGRSGYRSFLNDCSSSGSVSGEDYLGGLLGEASGDVTFCGSTSAVTGGKDVGGLVGRVDGAGVTNCCSSGTVSGGQYVGGVTGMCSEGSVISSCSTGNVVGERQAGGLVGRLYDGVVTDCYSTGSVSGNTIVGGLVGDLYRGTVTNAFCAGRVVSGGILGGLVGTLTSGPNLVDNCFWDVNASGTNRSAGGTGLATGQMKNINTYLNAGWDFVRERRNGTEDIWWMLGEGMGYPQLWWEEQSSERRFGR